MLKLLVDGALARRQQAPVGNVPRMAGPGAVQRLIPGEPGIVRLAGPPAGMKDVELWLPRQTPTELVALRADGDVLDRCRTGGAAGCTTAVPSATASRPTARPGPGR